MSLVLLCGIPQSGKSEVCDAIVSRFSNGKGAIKRVFVVKARPFLFCLGVLFSFARGPKGWIVRECGSGED